MVVRRGRLVTIKQEAIGCGVAGQVGTVTGVNRASVWASVDGFITKVKLTDVELLDSAAAEEWKAADAAR
eukprot:4812964-Prymnesium_polylepis.1